MRKPSDATGANCPSPKTDAIVVFPCMPNEDCCSEWVLGDTVEEKSGIPRPMWRGGSRTDHHFYCKSMPHVRKAVMVAQGSHIANNNTYRPQQFICFKKHSPVARRTRLGHRVHWRRKGVFGCCRCLCWLTITALAMRIC